MAMGHHQTEEPHLVPGMAPMLTRVLAVGGDTSTLGDLVTNLRLRGYQGTIYALLCATATYVGAASASSIVGRLVDTLCCYVACTFNSYAAF
jgi:hypothetical protein